VIGIIERHNHIFAPGRFPGWWVRCLQRNLRPYEPILRDYPLREYLDTSGVMASSMSVLWWQTNWAKARFEDETAGGKRHLRGHRLAAFHLSYADFVADDVRPAVSPAQALTLWCLAVAQCSCTGKPNPPSSLSPRALISARIRRFVSTSRSLAATR